MDITYELLPDPHNFPFLPTTQDIVVFAQELEEEQCLTFEWADGEIKNYLMDYVRVGLIAQQIKIKRLWFQAKGKYKDFRDYCEKGLGISRWYANRLIDAAQVAIKLVQAGFNHLPRNEAQARPLAKYLKSPDFDPYDSTQKLPEEILAEKWQEVLNSAPPHRITAAKVAEIVEDNPQPPVKQQVRIRTSTLEKLKQAALDAGMTLDDYLDTLLGTDETNSEITEEPAQQNSDVAPITIEEMSRWVEDMQHLLIEKFGLVDRHSADSS